VNHIYTPIPAALPLLLWKTPPGLELILAQEGVPYEVVQDPHPLILRGGRFILFDGRTTPRASLAAMLTPEHVAIDVDSLRRGEACDPFAALVDTRAAHASWNVGFRKLTERVSRHDRGRIRRRLIGRLRQAVTAAGGVWIRLAPFPHPYRSAFSFRADLDEPVADDYFRYAEARAPLADCCTHFVSTHAYAHHPSVLRDLKDHDTQSHGHHHHVYRDPESNRLNLERAHRILASFGFEPSGFAAPHGRWSPGLDDALEDFGYLFSSDFQLGYDDFPFFPWKGGRFSRVLQIPVHPVCEGLFLEAGLTDGQAIGEHLASVVAARLDAGELAIAYGHPERRLGRMPEVLRTLAGAVESSSLVWRVTFVGLARWWRWRAERKWLVIPREDHRLEIQFSEWDREYDIALEIHRGDFFCSVPLTGPRMSLGLGGLAYQRGGGSRPLPEPPEIERPSPSLKQAIRVAIDWETVTPLSDIPRSSLPNRVKRGLRWWKLRRAEAGG
jgi:peptidoglycan/xylan/chitin deacetylase (PgdA/CDA1 family)